jgi:hypothetical protein
VGKQSVSAVVNAKSALLGSSDSTASLMVFIKLSTYSNHNVLSSLE